MVFPVVMYGCENWMMKKAEYQRIDAFWTVVLEKTLEGFLDCKRSSQSVLKEINPEYSLEGLKLKLQYFGYLVKSQFIGKDPDAGKDWRQKEKGMTGWNGWMASPTQWTWVWVNSRSWWWTGRPGILCFMGLQRVGHDWVTELNCKYNII